MKTKNVVILGGGYAGVNAALRLRVRNKEAIITVVNESPWFIERIRNHQAAAGEKLTRYDLGQILGKSIRFEQARAEKIDGATRHVTVRSEAGLTTLEYDVLVYAMGSGQTAHTRKGMFNITTRADAEELQIALAENPKKSVVVIGAGLTGLELVTELREKWPERGITLADNNEPGRHLSPRARQYLTDTLQDMRISVESMKIDRFASDAPIAEDTIVVSCAGFASPNLARESGFKVDDKNRVIVNENLQVEGYPEIFVCGDAAAYGFGSRELAYSGCATAMPMGTYIGEAVAALLAQKPLPGFHYGFTFQCIGLGRKNGIIQFLDKRTGEANARILTGKSAAIFKELICKMTITLPKWERKTRWPFYTWRKTRLMKRIGVIASKAA